MIGLVEDDRSASETAAGRSILHENLLWLADIDGRCEVILYIALVRRRLRFYSRIRMGKGNSTGPGKFGSQRRKFRVYRRAIPPRKSGALAPVHNVPSISEVVETTAAEQQLKQTLSEERRGSLLSAFSDSRTPLLLAKLFCFTPYARVRCAAVCGFVTPGIPSSLKSSTPVRSHFGCSS
jgi:hypothetical protein